MKLKYNKYYIGKTINPNYRLKDHFTKGGSEWTKKYKPVSILELKHNCNDCDEQIVTELYETIWYRKCSGGLGVK